MGLFVVSGVISAHGPRLEVLYVGFRACCGRQSNGGPYPKARNLLRVACQPQQSSNSRKLSEASALMFQGEALKKHASLLVYMYVRG